MNNGLKVLFIESHKSPVVTVQMWVRTGSADESKGIEGISHFIEHLVFKGTKTYKVGEIAKTVEECGGDLNAYTSFDQTVFHVTLSSTETNTALQVVNEMTSSPIFDPTEVNNEREVVIEEIKRGLDSPGRVAGQLLFSTVYKEHPYGLPVIGYDKIIKKVSVDKIKKYFNQRYHPKNMFLVICGDFKTKELLKKVKTDFVYPKANAFKKVTRKKEPAQKALRLKVQKSTFQDNFLYLAFRLPDIKHKDIPALDLLSMILGQGDSSRLVKSLRIDTALVNSVGTSAYTQKDSGMFLVSATYKTENLKEVLNGIKAHLIKIKSKITHEFNEAELNKAKLNVESGQYYSLETVDRLANSFASMEFYFEDPHFFDTYLRRVNQLEISDLVKVIERWLKTDTLTITCLTKDDAETKKILTQWVKELKKEFSKLEKANLSLAKMAKVKTLKAKTKTPKSEVVKLKHINIGLTKNPETEIVKLKNGTVIYFRHQKESPVVSVKAAFTGGLRAEPALEQGTTEMLSRSWISGTPKMTESEIYHFFEARAAQIGSFAGRNTVGVNAEFLAPFEESCGAVYSDVLFNSLFKEDVIEREKQILLHQIQSRNDKPAQLGFLKMNELLFPNHPYGKDMLGTLETAAKISQANILNLWNKIGFSNNLTVSIVGQFNMKYWIDLFENQPLKMSKNELNFFKPITLAEIKEDSLTKIIQKKEQSHVAIAYRGITLTSPEKYTLQILNSLLSGQGGRLFVELRDKNSLAYTVAPINFEGIETGYTGAYIACSPEKVDKAIEMLKAEFNKLITTPISEDELQKSKRNLIGSHHIEMQRSGSLANMLLFTGIYNLDVKEIFDLDKLYSQITPADIQNLAAKLYKQKETIVVVGP